MRIIYNSKEELGVEIFNKNNYKTNICNITSNNNSSKGNNLFLTQIALLDYFKILTSPRIYSIFRKEDLKPYDYIVDY